MCQQAFVADVISQQASAAVQALSACNALAELASMGAVTAYMHAQASAQP